MTDALRSLAIGELIRKTFRVYKQRPTSFIAISIIGPLLAAGYPFAFWLFRTSGGTQQEPVLSWLPTIVGTLVSTTLMLLGSMLSSAAIARPVAALREHIAAAERHLQPTMRLWSIVGIVCALLLRMFLAALLFTFIGVIVLAAAAALGFNSAVAAGAIGFAVAAGWLIGIILASIRIYARYALAIPSCVLEGLGRRPALKRSALLTSRARGRVAVFYSAFMIVSCVIAVAELMLLTRTDGIAVWMTEAATALLSGALLTPFWTIGVSLIYCEERDLAESEATHASAEVASVSV